MKPRLVPDNWIPVLLIVLGACARLVPHPWNATPMMAIGLYAGARSAKLWSAVLITVAALLLSDSILGFYSGMPYVYAASLVPAVLGWCLRERGSLEAIVASAVFSSVSFFLITNTAVWATGSLYPHTWAGLGACFMAALPFYRNEIAGDALYTCAFFGTDALLRAAVRAKPQAA
jgi:hypothetical protein